MVDFAGELKFDEKGLIPVVAQDYKTGEVLMVAYMNADSLAKSIETGKMHYWSRSRNKLWLKGETSGNFQYIKSLKADCDNDTLLALVEQTGNACHTGKHSCFFKNVGKDGIKDCADGNNSESNSENIIKKDEKIVSEKSAILDEVYNVIKDRLVHPKEGSYTNYLFEKGLDKILKKVGEETAEVIIASKNKAKNEIVYEIADLFYHLMVLMVERDVKLDDIYEELQNRR